MRVDKDDQIAGVPATDLRRAFRVMRDEHYRRLDELCAALSTGLGLTQAQAKATTAQLIAEGYFDRGELGYALMERGLRLAAASTGKPIPRAKAEQFLDELLERARAINQSDSWHRIAQIELFGSLLDPSRATVNDIDLLVTLELRYEIPADNNELITVLNAYRRGRTGKDGGTLMQLFSFPAEEVFKQLKAGKRVYQLLDAASQDKLRDRTACKIVFEDHADPLPLPAALR
jgi:predicted nucleotidyltransferase